MTIPSSLLIQEIMHYEGFSPKPVLNRVGMPCIGYGFPLWEEAFAVLHGKTKLAQIIKNNLPREQENMDFCMQRLLQLPLVVTEEKARQLLEQSLLFYAEELGKKYAGFRHLVNLCSQYSQGGNAVIYPQSSLAEYETQLVVQNQRALEKYAERASKTGKKQTNKKTASISQEPLYFSKPNGTTQNLHPAFLPSFYSSSEAFAGANPFSQYHYFSSGKKTKHKKSRFFSSLLLTKEEQALVRVDSVLFVTHLLGLEMTLQMHDFFLALLQDNYAEAGSQLLSHSVAAYLGAIMAILARRIREASLDYCDLTVQKAEMPKMHFHHKKAKNYFVQYFQNRRKFPEHAGSFEQTEHYGQQPGVYHA